MILHVDMDAFFAAVEQREDPRIRGKPVLVCGDPERRSVVAAASYEARPSGVRSGMPIGEARRLCPQAICVPGNPSKYVAVSLQLLELFKRVAPQVEPMSIDEAFLDLRGTSHDDRAAASVARELQEQVRSRFALTCSVGLGPNKLVAKMGATLEQQNGFTSLTLEGFRQRFWPEPVDALWGIGSRTASALQKLGIDSIGDLAQAAENLLSATFGINGPRMRYAARGEDESAVIPY